MKRFAYLLALAVLVFGAAPVSSVQAADLQTATTALRQGDYARAFQEFTAVAQKAPDNVKVLYVLAQMHERGLGTEENTAKAADFYLRAADLGKAEAQFKIAEFYERGEGVPLDPEKAVRWYMAAAEQGESPNAGVAAYRLAKAFTQGLGVSQNELQAEIWLRRAANQGVTDAQYMLGEMLFYISIPPHNNAEAYMWMRTAAALGHEKANKKRRLYAIFMTPNQLVEGEEMFLERWPEFAPKSESE